MATTTLDTISTVLRSQQIALNDELHDLHQRIKDNGELMATYGSLLGDIRILGEAVRKSVASQDAADAAAQQGDDDEAESLLREAINLMPGDKALAGVGISARSTPTSTNGISAPPVQTSRSTGRTDARDGTLLPPAPPSSEPSVARRGSAHGTTGTSDEAPDWAKELLATLDTHAKGCNEEFEKIREDLTKLSDAALSKEYVEVLTKRPADELDTILSALDGINKERLTTLLKCFEKTDLTHLVKFFAVLNSSSPEALETALRGGTWVNKMTRTRLEKPKHSPTNHRNAAGNGTHTN